MENEELEFKYISYEESYGLDYYTHGAPFNGSYKGMRYRIERNPLKIDKKDTETVPVLIATVWPEPMNYDHTAEELKIRETFNCDKEGKVNAVAWLNEQYEKKFLKR